MSSRGAFVHRIVCVRDSVDDICNAIRESLERRPAFIFITGGLGPTKDDKTLSALSKLAKRRIVVSRSVLRTMSARRNIPSNSYLPHQRKMVRTLRGADCLPNPIGWAPVTVVRLGKCTVFALPGPPKEVQACFNEYIAGCIEEITKQRSCAKRVVVTLHENELEPLTAEVSGDLNGVYLKTLVGDGVYERRIDVEILAIGKTEEECLRKCQAALDKLKELVRHKGGEVLEP